MRARCAGGGRRTTAAAPSIALQREGLRTCPWTAQFELAVWWLVWLWSGCGLVMVWVCLVGSGCGLVVVWWWSCCGLVAVWLWVWWRSGCAWLGLVGSGCGLTTVWLCLVVAWLWSGCALVVGHRLGWSKGPIIKEKMIFGTFDCPPPALSPGGISGSVCLEPGLFRTVYVPTIQDLLRHAKTRQDLPSRADTSTRPPARPPPEPYQPLCGERIPNHPTRH